MNMKKNTKKSKRAKRSKNPPLFLITSIVFVSILIWLAYGAYARSEDKKRFEQAEKTINSIIEDISGHADTLERAESISRCYDSEYGPYNNGRLWCSTSVATTINFASDDNTPTRLGNLIQDAVDERGLDASHVRNSDIEFYGAPGLPCTVELSTTKAKKTVNLVFRCSDRAKAKHYPYSD